MECQLACACTARRRAHEAHPAGFAREIFEGVLRGPEHAANMPETGRGHRSWITS